MGWGSLLWLSGSMAAGGVFVTAHASVTLAPSLSVSERYDDNFFFSADDREDETVTLISPALTLAYDTRSVSLAVSYQGSAEFYYRNSDANTYRQTTSVALNLPLLSRRARRLEVDITEAATYTPELPAFSLTDQAREANQGVLVGRTNTVRNRAGIVLGYHWSHRTVTSLSYSNLLTRFDRSDLVDSTAHEAGARIDHHVSAVTRLSTEYGASVTNFEANPTTRAVTHRVSMGVERQLSERVSVNGDIGVVAVDDDVSRIVGDIGLSRTNRSSTLALEYLRSAGNGGGVVSAVTVSDRVTARITKPLRDDLRTTMQVGYANNRSLPDGALRIVSYEVGAGLTARFLAWLVADLSYSYLRQDARGGLGSTGERNLVVVTFTGTAAPREIIQ